MWLKFIRRDRGSFSGGLLPFLPVCCRDRAERVFAVRVMRRYGKSIWGGVIGFLAALCPYDLVYESKVDMIFSAIALITGTATEFPNCL